MNLRIALFLFVGSLLPWFAKAQQQPGSAQQQKMSKGDRERVREMFSLIAVDVKKHYYDPNFHGVDWSAVTRSTEQAIDNSASLNHAMSEIAAGLDKLDDTHTFFLPPTRPYTHDLGWQLLMVGDHCFVTQVRPQSDAASKGIKRGDEILTLNGFQPDRNNLWKMTYVFDVLRPQPGLHVMARSPGAQPRQVDVMAAMRERKKVVNLTFGSNTDIWDVIREGETDAHFRRARTAEIGPDVLVLKFPSFEFTEGEVGEMIGKARKHRALILDLRGNPGGSVDALKALLGEVLDHDVKIGDRVTRDGTKAMVAKSHGHNSFTGKLVVLVDNKSASAAEIFPRVTQLEKRSTILGDRTAGAVMESKHYNYKLGTDTVIFFGASITDADIVMADGKSLEHTGVTPDEIILPTASDLAAGRDPVLVRAAELCGATITPEAAGALFPYEWPPL
jgi:carboxyl-terminal processing protease